MQKGLRLKMNSKTGKMRIVVKKIRKPRDLSNETNLYPRIRVTPSKRILVQAVPTGNWKKVPIKRAERLLERLKRAIQYANQ